MRRFFCISLMSMMLLALPMKAQYPSVPADVQAAVDKMMEKCWASSDSAFAVALPIIEAEAAQGRPYVKLALKPNDLLRADIPAFPGAE
ncbi:MAG: polysaccharide lyase, partial [Bacteroidales bacterium]|nr:polysaccharide lyase [Bacteroidales bacterium]